MTKNAVPVAEAPEIESMPDPPPAASERPRAQDYDGPPQVTPLEPQISLLEEEFLEIFAVESNPFQDNSIPPQAIPPFKPSAQVPAAAVKFRAESMAMRDQVEGGDIYSKLKAALTRVVSTPDAVSDEG